MSECRCSVLMTADAVGGVWTYSVALAREFSRAGMHVTIAVLGPTPTDEQLKEVAAMPGVDIAECNEPLEWMDDPWAGVKRSGEYLLDLAREIKPDIAHLNGYTHGALRLECPKIVVAHSCVLSWWEAVKCETAPARYAEYRRNVAAGLQRADQIVAPSTYMLRALRRHYGESRGLVIYNGMEPPIFVSRPKETFVFCASRIWDEAKNVRTYAAAAKGSQIPFYLAGPGSIDESWRDVHVLGRLSSFEMSSWFERAAIYASPALYEPFGLATLEAASYGAALILGDIASQREIWGDAAVFVSPRDPVGLRRAVERVATDVELRQILARRARRRARQFTLEKQVRLYSSLYAQLIHRHANMLGQAMATLAVP